MANRRKKNTDNNIYMILDLDGDFVGPHLVMAVGYLEFDTDFFGKKIGFLTFRYDGISPIHFDAQLERLHDKASWKNYDCLYVRVPSEDIKMLNVLERQGYELRDTLLTLVYELKNEELSKRTKDSYNIRLFEEEDSTAICSISINEYNHSRFFTDQHLAHKASEMYAAWALNDAHSEDTAVWVIEKDGEVSGYISCKYDWGDRTGIINLIAVKKEEQSNGLGKALLYHAIEDIKEKGLPYVQVGTHLSNTNALNFYLKSGFVVEKSEHSLHKWLT